MSTTSYASVIGLGFGDCGKGRFVDALVRRRRAHTVVRFNGGAQAGHNVVDAAGARHHTFSQFGSGSFVGGAATVLLAPFVLHPGALLAEAQALASVGVGDCLSRLFIDARCLLTTPWHQAGGRLRELRRGPAAHGTCGVGVGETVLHALARPEEALVHGDFTASSSAAGQRQWEKVSALRGMLRREFADFAATAESAAATAEWKLLGDDGVAARWLNATRLLARQCPPASLDQLGTHLTRPGHVVFEGAQGVLLDEWRGFHPHTTWSSTTPDALAEAVAPLGLGGEMEHFGVLRTYLTRHGAGPFPTHDPALDATLPELHNSARGWQGAFRRGHPDAVLLRYALACAGPLHGLLVSHLDAFDRGAPLRWCERHQTGELAVGKKGDLPHQSALTAQLNRAQPQYDAAPIGSASDFLERLAAVTSLPVILSSRGPAEADIDERAAR